MKLAQQLHELMWSHSVLILENHNVLTHFPILQTTCTDHSKKYYGLASGSKIFIYGLPYYSRLFQVFIPHFSICVTLRMSKTTNERMIKYARLYEISHSIYFKLFCKDFSKLLYILGVYQLFSNLFMIYIYI